MTIRSGHHLYRAVWVGAQLQIPVPLKTDETPAQFVKIEVGGGTLQRTAEEYQTLMAGVKACPIPVYLDGLQINNLSYPADTMVGKLSHAYLAVGACAFTEDKFQALPRAVSLDRTFSPNRISDKFTDDRPLQSYIETSPTLDFFWQLEFGFKIICWGNHAGQEFEFECPNRRSTLNWIVDGVVCHTESWGEPSAVCLHLYLSGDDLATDLSGFQFLEESGALRRERLSIAHSRIAFTVNRSVRALRSRFPKPFARELLARAAFLTFPSLILPPPLNLVSLGLLGFTTLHSVAKKYRLLKACKEHLDEYLERGVPPKKVI